MLGALSYGIFLNHYLVLWTLFDGRVAGIGQALGFLAISAALAFVLYRSVERPVLSYRYRLRADSALQSRADPAFVADGSPIVRTSNGEYSRRVDAVVGKSFNDARHFFRRQ